MKKIFKSKKHIVISIMFIIFLVLSLFVYFNNTEKTNKNVIESNNLVSKNEKVEDSDKKEEEKTEELKSFYVDIKGQINNPGVYLVNETNIVNDVINFAGGLNENADTKCINLSMKVSEEMVIYIYSKSETWDMVNNNKTTNKICNTITNNAYYNTKEEANTTKSNTQTNTTTETKEEDSIININTADISKLTKLPGIGENKAKDIIEYREQNGLFNSIEDIKNVSGIGNSTYEKLKDKITV